MRQMGYTQAAWALCRQKAHAGDAIEHLNCRLTDMKASTCIVLMCTLIAAGSAVAQGPGVIARGSTAWDVGRRDQVHAISWRQGESVVWDYALQTNGTGLDLSNTNLVVVWDVVAATNLYQVWIASTGEVVNATGGQVRVSLDPAESVLLPGSYRGYVTLLSVVGTNVDETGVAVPQAISVGYAADRRYTS